jgi:hypothetical protein
MTSIVSIDPCTTSHPSVSSHPTRQQRHQPTLCACTRTPRAGGGSLGTHQNTRFPVEQLCFPCVLSRVWGEGFANGIRESTACVAERQPASFPTQSLPGFGPSPPHRLTRLHRWLTSSRLALSSLGPMFRVHPPRCQTGSAETPTQLPPRPRNSRLGPDLGARLGGPTWGHLVPPRRQAHRPVSLIVPKLIK